jgi:hypothetical protein
MPDDKKSTTRATGELTVDELIRDQLEGKSKALERYDQILWKVRSGYVVVLYGLLTILAGRDFQLAGAIGMNTAIGTAFWMAVGMSTCGLLIDLRFLASKLMVIEARDRLSDLALDIATRQKDKEQAHRELRGLLQLSGEKLPGPIWEVLLLLNWPILSLYLVTPVVIAFVWLLR